MPQATVTIRELKNKETGLDIGIPDWKVIPGLLASTVEYHIVAVTNLQCFKLPKHKEHEVVQFMVPKTADDIELLKKNLTTKFPGTIFPPLPRKTFGILDSNIKERKTTIENFLKHLVSTPKLASSQIFLQFLGLSPYKANQSKSEEKAGAVSSSSTEKPDLFEELKQEQVSDLFTDLADDDLDLFKPGSKSSSSAGALFGDGAENSVGGPLKLFDEQDLGGAMDKDEVDTLFLPSKDTIKEKSVPEIEDNTELLTIKDDVDDLFKPMDKKPIPSAKPVLPQKPTPASKPPLAAKPKPALKPKPSSVSSASASSGGKADPGQTDESAADKLGASDILKYIETNTKSNEDDLDLFS